MSGAPDPATLQAELDALRTLGAAVDPLVARLEHAAGDAGPALSEELDEVASAIDRVKGAIRAALAGEAVASPPPTPPPDEDRDGAPLAEPDREAIAAIARDVAVATLDERAAELREQIVARTITEVSSRTAKGLADLMQSPAFINRVVPSVLTRAEGATQRAIGELRRELRQELKEKMAEFQPASAGGGAPANPGAIVDEVLKRVHDAGVLDQRPAKLDVDFSAGELLESDAFKEMLEERLHHIVTYIKADVVPGLLKERGLA